MEIILIKDVENLGFTDDVLSVKNGYGRNYLIPQGFAILATSSAKKILAEKLRQRAFKEKHIIEEASKQAEKLRALELKIPAKVGEGDKLFGSINNQNLADALKKAEFDIEKKFISVIGGNIKRVGKYEAKIRLHREVVVDFPFEVTPVRDEKAIAAAKKAKEEEAKRAEEAAKKAEEAAAKAQEGTDEEINPIAAASEAPEAPEAETKE